MSPRTSILALAFSFLAQLPACATHEARTPRVATTVPVAAATPAPTLKSEVKRLALARFVDRFGPLDDPGQLADDVEPFVGRFGAWLDPSHAKSPATRYDLARYAPKPAAFLAAGTVLRDRHSAAAHADPFALLLADGQARAVDLATEQVRWAVPMATSPDAIAVGGARAIVTGRFGVRALDRKTGADAWQANIETYSNPPALSLGGTVIFGGGRYGAPERQLVAVDELTGERRWARTLPPSRRKQSYWPQTTMRGDDNRVVASAGDNVALVVSVQTGEVLAQLSLPGRLTDATLAGDTVIALVGSGDGYMESDATLVAYSLENGRELWRAHGDDGGPLHVVGYPHVLHHAGLVFFTAVGLARIYDADDGALLWDWSVGSPGYGIPGVGEVALVALSTEDTTLHVAYATQAGFFLFGPAESPPPAETAVIHGQVLSSEKARPVPGISVTCHGASAISDGQGNYQLTVRTRGTVVLTIGAGNHDRSRALSLDGRGDYTQDLQISQECPEGCAEED